MNDRAPVEKLALDGGRPVREKFLPFGLPLIGEEEMAEVRAALESGWLTTGPRTQQFGKDLAAYVGAKHAIPLNSCTGALHLALAALGVGPGDEVITSPLTFVATTNVVLHLGAKVVFADIDRETFNLDPKLVEAAITARTKVILPVHFAGYPCDLDVLHALAGPRGIKVVEDAAHAISAEYQGRRIGSLSDATCFSFYPTKNMTTGEGGMITTNDEELAARLRLLRDHGQKTRYEHVVIGFNFRMNDISAAIGIEQLKKLEGFNEKRIANAKVLSDGLSDVKQIKTPYVPEGYRHVFHQYSIRARKRDGLKDYLNLENIRCGIYYPRLVTENKPIQPFATRPTPKAEKATKEVLSLPIHPGLSRDDLARMVNSVAAFYVEK